MGYSSIKISWYYNTLITSPHYSICCDIEITTITIIIKTKQECKKLQSAFIKLFNFKNHDMAKKVLQVFVADHNKVKKKIESSLIHSTVFSDQ